MNKSQSHIDKIGWQFDNTYTKLPDNMFSKLSPIPVEAPGVVIFNHGFLRGVLLPGAPNKVPLFANNLN